MSRQEEAEETCLSGKRRAGGVGAGHQRASAQELEKEQWPAEGPRASSDWKMLRVSVCASDFSSQRKKSGGSHLRDHFCQLC